MSKDIRSYFARKVATPKCVIIDDNDDVIPESPEIQNKKKKKHNKKRKVLDDDSDEEQLYKKKKLSTPSTSSRETKRSDGKSKMKTSTQIQLKEVKATDIFGSAPIKRTEPMVKKQKRNIETGIHSDDDFDKSLMEIDELEEMAMRKVEGGKSSKQDSNDIKLNREISRKKVESNHDDESTKTNYDQNADNKKYTEENKNRNKGSKKDKSKDLFADFINHDPVKEELVLKKVSDEDTIRRRNETECVKVEKGKIEQNGAITDNDITVIENSEDETKHKKQRMNRSLNDSALTDEERHERKIYSVQLYKKYLNRSGPKHLGAKQIPKASPDCLKNCAFLLTGVLDSFEREEVTEAITKFGGCVKNSISKKVTHVLAGEDAGPAKMAKASDLGIKIINEDEFLQMIVDQSKKKTNINLKVKSDEKLGESSKKKSNNVKKVNDNDRTKDTKKSPSGSKYESKKINDEKEQKSTNISCDVFNSEESENRDKKHKTPKKCKYKDNINEKTVSEAKIDLKDTEQILNDKVKSNSTLNVDEEIITSLMWVEKYKPQNLKQIIGQHGDASNVKKLVNWLSKWYISRKTKTPKPSPWAKSDDGAFYKAALLSGPPGVGKTTTVALVCKELDFDMVEFNASDTRNKTLIKEQIGELLTTTSLSAYAKGNTGKQAVTKKHVLVMDEVDGMAGNEDRGGLQELIALIKSTSVPIICMCNDRNSQKMRSLLNYCYELRFNRPRVDQIKSAMLSICYKEGIKIPPDALTRLIVAAGQDVRQTLNMLSMWAVNTDESTLQRDANTTRKDLKLGPWEAVRKVFTEAEHKKMSINDRSDLFFYDYSIAPLFVQENYLNVMPHCPKNKLLEMISRAADSISRGDLVEARIRRNQAWSLLPIQAMYSSVIPGHAMAGHVTGQIQFPSWLGKNSRANKINRLCQEIHAHTRLSTTGSKSSIYLDYSTHLRDAIVNPLLKDKTDGISKSIEILESYHLLREDLDSLTELSLWPGQRNPMILVDPKVKAAMTRTYNKNAAALPYAPGAVRKQARADDDPDSDHENDYDTEYDSDPEHDALIKKKKAPVASTAGSSKEKTNTSKGKKRNSVK